MTLHLFLFLFLLLPPTQPSSTPQKQTFPRRLRHFGRIRAIPARKYRITDPSGGWIRSLSLLRGGEALPPPSVEPPSVLSGGGVSLTVGGIYTLWKGDTKGRPVLQVVEMKKTTGPSGPSSDRYTLLLSDGKHTQKAMLAIDLNPLVEQRGLCELCAVKLVDYISNSVSGRRIVVINEMELLAAPEEMGGKIGNPVPVEEFAEKIKRDSESQITVHSPAALSPGPQDEEPQLVPIGRLSPYISKWRVMGKVTARTGIKHWGNARGAGKLFSANIIDQEGSEIRCTFFNEAVDKFFDLMEEGKSVEVGRGRLKPANKQYSSLKAEYEINLGSEAHIKPVDNLSIKGPRYDFKPIMGMESTEPNSVVDIIAIVKGFGEVRNITTKQGKELAKREVSLVDDSNCQIRATIWGDMAEKADIWESNPIISLRGVKVSEWGGRSLSTGAGTIVKVNPTEFEDETKKLKAWWKFNSEKEDIKHLTVNNDGTPADLPKGGKVDMEIKDPHFIPISQLEESPPNTIVDVIGIVKFASDSVKITSRNGREVEKQTLSLVDDSNVEVNVAIWGERASASSPLTASWERCPVLALQGVRVSDYDGRTLSVITTTKIEVDPNIERADQLREWFAVQGSTATPRMISTAPADDRPVGNLDIRNIEELNSLIANLEAGETIVKYVEITTGVEFIKRESAWYPACPKNDCNTKVIPDGQGGYRCEKCDQTHSSKTNRYVLQATLQDDTGSTWVTAFGDQALLLMDGLSADALERFQNEDLDKFDHAFQATQGKKFKFTIRLKSEEYQEQKRVRPIVVKIEEIHEPDTAVSAAEGGV